MVRVSLLGDEESGYGKREEIEKNHWKVHICPCVGWERYRF